MSWPPCTGVSVLPCSSDLHLRTTLCLLASPLPALDWLLFEDRGVFAGVLVRLLQRNRTNRIYYLQI